MFKHKRLAAIVMSLMMVLSLIPAMAFAEGGTSSIKIKVNDDDSQFEVKKGEQRELRVEITGMEGKSYHIHWEKKGGQKNYSFVDDIGNTVEDKSATGNVVKIKGMIATSSSENPPKLIVAVVEGEHDESCLGISDSISDDNKKELTINVTDVPSGAYEYGPQGLDPTDSEAQSLVMIVPDKITQLYPNADGQELVHYLNKIDTPFDISDPIKFTFIVNKGMGNKYNEDAFIENAINNIVITDGDKTIASYRMENIKFLGRNNDNSRSVIIQAEGLKPGDYTLIFGKNLKPSENGDELGVDIEFQFSVVDSSAKDQIDNPSNDTSNQPVDNQDTDNSGKTDSDTVNSNDSSAKTGDNMNIALYAGIMLVALCGGVAVFVRRRKEQ